jgi:hypothetical protein
MESLALSPAERVEGIDDVFGYDWGAQAAGLLRLAARQALCAIKMHPS